MKIKQDNQISYKGGLRQEDRGKKAGRAICKTMELMQVLFKEREKEEIMIFVIY